MRLLGMHTIRAEQAEARAGLQRQLDLLQHGPARVTEGGVFQREQR